MKLRFLVTVILLGSFFIFNKAGAVNSGIVINEIGAYPTSTHEWVEIWNKGNESIDIKDWKFWENNTNHGLKAVTTSDSIISPNEYAVICQDSDVFLLDYPNFSGSVFDSSWVSLSEDGEQIGLKDSSGNFVEEFNYVSTTKFSLERKDPFLNDYTLNNWQENISGNTIGSQNSNFYVNVVTTTIVTSTSETTTIPTSTEQSQDSQINTSSTSSVFDWSTIKLNEILSDPIDGNEMVELYNNSSTSLDMTGASICDSSGSGCKFISSTIFGHDWLVTDLLTDRYLNNDGDSVILKDSENNIIDEVVYGTNNNVAPDKGQSLARKIDGVDTNSDSDWAITTKITLGNSNELVAPVVKTNNSGSNGGSGGYVYNSSLISTTSIKTNKITVKVSTTTISDPTKISFKLDWPYGLDVNEIGQFSAQGTADPRGGSVNLWWNFGDSATSTGFLVSHSYTTSGVYLVTVSASSTANTFGKKDFVIYVGPDFSISKSQVKIGDYLVDATSSEDEFVELKNLATSSQNISNWKIKNSSGKEYIIPENTIIPSSTTLKYFRSVTHLSFDKNGDVVLLASSNDKELDRVILKNEKANKVETKTVKTNSTVSVSNWHSAKGIVTVLPGIFGSQYFYIFDGEKGYQVYQYKKDFPSLKIGDHVIVRGVESVVSGVNRIKINNKNSVDILATEQEAEPLILNTEELVADSVGALVKINGDVTLIKSNYLYIDDDSGETVVYFRPAVKIDNQNFKLGDKLEVVGILEQTKNGFRVSPRGNEDIKVIGYSDEVLSQQNQAGQASQNEVRNKYLTVTAGGVATLLLGFLARARGAMLVGGAKKIASVVGNVIKRG